MESAKVVSLFEVASVSSILWERYNPVFVDIEKDNFTIDVDKIESKITKNTKAILAVQVVGYTCNLEKIDLSKIKEKIIQETIR